MTRADEPLHLLVFVSSPGDLPSTRRRAKEVMKNMGAVDIAGRRVEFHPLLWEDHTPAVVGNTPQLAVDYYMGEAGRVDIYVGMFWARMGSPVVVQGKRHASGTVYEFRHAYASYKHAGRPPMLLYRCERDGFESGQSDQFEDVRSFFDGFKGEFPQYEGLPRGFKDDDALAAMLERDLRIVAARLLEEDHQQMRGGMSRQIDDISRSEHSVLVRNVRAFLGSFEDLFGDGREREDAFNLRYKALPDPWRPDAVFPQDELPRPGESLLTLHEQWGRRMAIIGPSGTGKTFALLQLMEELAARAHRDCTEAVPVYFNLSSWTPTLASTLADYSITSRLARWLNSELQSEGGGLEQWFEDQLVRNYAMPRKAARRLIGSNRIVYCLDGLDELGVVDSMADDADLHAARRLREACARAINQIVADESARVVLCCRESTWNELTVKPRLGPPLVAQRLTEAAALRHLRQWPSLDGLHQALGSSSKLVEKARTPLFLAMMSVAYRGMNEQAILHAAARPESDWEDHLIHHYVQRCIDLAPPSSDDTRKDLIPSCLGWIASQPDNDFLLDDMQPSMLRESESPDDIGWWRRYRMLSVGLLAGSLAVLESLPCGLSLGIEWGDRSGISMGLWKGAIVFATTLATVAPLYLMAFAGRSWVNFGICNGLAFGIGRGWVVGLSAPGSTGGVGGSFADSLKATVVTAPCAAVVFALLGFQLYERIASHQRRYARKPGIQWYEIQPIEALDWRWIDPQSRWRGGWIGLLIGPLVGVAVGASYDMARGLSFGFIVTLMVTLFSGLSGTGIRVSLGPNQGIERSLRQALRMTAIFVVAGVLAFGVSYGSAYGGVQGVVNACLGVCLVFAFYIFGGIPVIRQSALGHILHLRGRLPSWWGMPPWRKTISFLNDLVRYKLLRRSAGGYMFRHETLRQYYRRASTEGHHT